MDQQNPQNINIPLAAMQPEERVLFEIKRHPMGLITTYLAVGIGMVLLAVLTAFIAQQVGSSNAQAVRALWAGFGIVMIVLVGIMFLSNIVYWGNRWVLTTDSITQVLQHSLFNKETAQLSLGNLEDVTAEQHGIIAHMFNYGTVKAETAGEREKFVFLYCPNPNHYAQMVLQAREAFEQNVREAGGASRSPYPNNLQQPPQA
jgi:uncharacterized membrane protein YdbT with pleckstrin-like domain